MADDDLPADAARIGELERIVLLYVERFELIDEARAYFQAQATGPGKCERPHVEKARPSSGSESS